ncbi:hypothetical protein BC829DRAFT_171094 [Chytridium lagenaria]|nr:hypothetical protein BC829DRAFT_171094 [Chytridium lagenaria]
MKRSKSQTTNLLHLWMVGSLFGWFVVMGCGGDEPGRSLMPQSPVMPGNPLIRSRTSLISPRTTLIRSRTPLIRQHRGIHILLLLLLPIRKRHQLQSPRPPPLPSHPSGSSTQLTPKTGPILTGHCTDIKCVPLPNPTPAPHDPDVQSPPPLHKETPHQSSSHHSHTHSSLESVHFACQRSTPSPFLRHRWIRLTRGRRG